MALTYVKIRPTSHYVLLYMLCIHLDPSADDGGILYSCFHNDKDSTCPSSDVTDEDKDNSDDANACCDGTETMTNFQQQGDSDAPCMACKFQHKLAE